MEGIRHEFLESHVFHSSNTSSAMEVRFCTISTLLPLPGIVNQELGNLAKRASLLSEVHDDTDATILSGSYALLDPMHEIGSAGADIGAKDIRPVALIMNPHSANLGRILQILCWSEDVDGESSDGGKEDLQVRSGDELGEHPTSLLEHASSEGCLSDVEPLGNAWKVPNMFDRCLGHHTGSIGLQNVAVGLQPALLHGLHQLQHLDVRLCDRNGWANIDSLLEVRPV
mmetsp:Transcript_5690/g.20028  ORF Transcript_5690/g.20028 Transcript_5690/m.20028 type:complete len:228 (+) Transcript_5690:376-1059(+)